MLEKKRILRLACILLWDVACLAGWAASPPKGPSVLIITLDTTRADRLGCYGCPKGLTPSLDAFSQKCFLFAHCEAPRPQTVPSHTSLFSGWDPIRHGVRKNLEEQVPAGVPLLAEEFRRSGYATGAFISACVLLPHYGLARGFQTYDTSFYDTSKPLVTERRAARTLEAALPWIQKQSAPWFCWVHLYDPHYPYEPPEPFAKRYANAPYDGEIAYMDSALGDFLGSLEARGLLSSAAVVICSDHGEGLGDHGEKLHGVFLYEATTHVPLLIRLPGQKVRTAVSDDVGLVDVAPTLRELCGLAAVPGDGVSLQAILQGKALHRKAVYLESLEALYNFGWAPLYATVKDHYKYVMAPREELYDLDSDPGETRNLASGRASMIQAMRDPLVRTVAEVKPPAAQPLSLSDEEMRNLQSLGYIAGTPGLKTPQPGQTYKDPKDGVPVLDLVTDAGFLIEQKKFPEAAAKLDAAVKLDPHNNFALFNLGKCLEQSDPNRAIDLYKKAVRERPEYPQPYRQLVTLLVATNRVDEADAVGKLGLKEAQDTDGQLTTLVAWTTLLKGRPEADVLGYLERARTLGPERSLNFMLRCALALKKGDRESAVRVFQHMAQACPPPSVLGMEGIPWFRPLLDDPRVKAVLEKARAKAR